MFHIETFSFLAIMNISRQNSFFPDGYKCFSYKKTWFNERQFFSETLVFLSYLFLYS